MTCDEREPARERPMSRLDLLRLQAEANQELLLAALRANEQMDEAQGAQQLAAKEIDALKAGAQELRTTAWDADRLAQALSNIASNAVEHAAPGSTVFVDARGEGDQVAIAITNAGSCIPPALLPVIFSAFRRAETRVGHRSGHLGLGLFVACELTRAHAGTSRVSSADGCTTFTMRLPRWPSPS